MQGTEAELEYFRQKWLEEVSARTGRQAPSLPPSVERSSQIEQSYLTEPIHPPSSAPSGRSLENTETAEEGACLAYQVVDGGGGAKQQRASIDEPISALEHYERAVEKETQGSLGDSLKLYRRAYRVIWHLAGLKPRN